MNTGQIKSIVSRMEALHFPQSSTMRKRLFSIIFRLDCAEYCTNLLKEVDFAQVDRFAEMNPTGSTPARYEIANDSTTISCSDGPDVAFHIKRLVVEILVSLDNSVDVMWECIETICHPQPPFSNIPARKVRIDLIASAESPLAIKDFVESHYKSDTDFRRAIDSLRNLFTHDDYLIRNDIESSSTEEAYGQLEFSGRATFSFVGDDSDLNLILSESDREYNSFCRNSVAKVKTMFEEFLTSLEQDLDNCVSLPLKYRRPD